MAAIAPPTSGLNNLETLQMAGNRIEEIEAESFKDNTALIELWMFINKLSVINQNMTTGLQSLEFFNLASNRIHTLGNCNLWD